MRWPNTIAPKDAESIWVIRAGIRGEADQLFLSEKIVVLHDPGMGDLRKLPRTRAAFCDAYRKLRPDETRTGTAGIGGKFFRFVHQVKNRDLVLYPSLKDKHVHLGRIIGAYRYSYKSNKKFPHQRPVTWFFSIPKSELSEFANRELGAARTFFRFSNHAEEIKKILARGTRRPKTKRN